MSDDLFQAVRIAAISALLGAFARVMLALHSGVRSAVLLCIEAGVGATLGVTTAAVAIYWHPELYEAGRGLLVVGGAAGFSGALGTRLIDMLVEAARKRLGGT
ncbi:hypothetical protein [Falsiroseomonas sp.]|uniref:hypothetical protein n=1 Tax=Falsiroseomonas sp. TaxID=2870721 RepID=UPI002734E8DE|nr:hypothetical protein [Falsiroseomonas sp.]MDP3414631.1 hypothetical protein [Falsiroseomonas sp.]